MTRFEHINYEMRKIISSCLSHCKNAKEISELLNIDPSAVSKELRRNRILSKEARKDIKDPVCPMTLRYPYVCNGCSKKYSCPLRQYRYDSKRAQEMADFRLVMPRRGINMTPEEFERLNRAVHEGIIAHNSIYHIVKTENPGVSVSTVYRYISNGYLTTKRLDLPYACTYKKRKKEIKKYEYPSNTKIDRSNRTYLDYLSFTRRHPNLFGVQMDFLGSIKKDSKSILTLLIPEMHFVMLVLVDWPDSKKINGLFEYLEERLGSDSFEKLFPFILTDRDPCFSDYEGIEANSLTGVIRTHVFYCDAFKSNQKAGVENMNRQLRKYFPKGKSIDYLNEERVHQINEFIIQQKLHSLSGFSSEEAFRKLYGDSLFETLMKALAEYR